jgi:Protein of unknown function (DUF3300)
MNALSKLNNLQHSAFQFEAFGWIKRILPCVVLILGLSPIALGQSVPLAPAQLDQLVSRIALYPDPLLAQTLTASTFWGEIPEAATWSDQHAYLTGDALAHAIQDDHLQWDPSVLGLLPFPSVLDMMARDPAWTQQLGNAVLTQRPELMDAVQRMRREARNYGYLVANGYVNVVETGGYIEILPLNPAVFYVPYYDPVVVFARPRPGFVVGTAIRFGPAVTISATFGTWGWWTGPAFFWPAHTIVIGGHPWERGWVNRGVYVHPYPHPWVRPIGPRVEIHHHR